MKLLKRYFEVLGIMLAYLGLFILVKEGTTLLGKYLITTHHLTFEQVFYLYVSILFLLLSFIITLLFHYLEDDNSVNDDVDNNDKYIDYIDNPRLENEDDIYYTGWGTTWDIDLDGRRYRKRYSSSITTNDIDGKRFSHLSDGDFIDEKSIL